MLIEIIFLNFTNHTYFDIKLRNIGINCRSIDGYSYNSLIDLDSIDDNTVTPINFSSYDDYIKKSNINKNDNTTYLNEIICPLIDADALSYIKWFSSFVGLLLKEKNNGTMIIK